MHDETLTQAQDKPPEHTMPVAVDVVEATVAGDTKRATLARAHRPSVAGYELHEVVGKGGMGVVYRAKQLGLDRDIAIKFLRDEFHPRSATGLRFLEEARITAQLQHPGIPAVHEVGALPDGRPYLAMKLIRGHTLDAQLKEKGPGAAKWLPIFESICQAVGFAHAHGVVHRDLKPSNVMVGAFGEVQVMDWGLAKVLGHESHLPPAIAEVSEPDADDMYSSRADGSIPSRADGSVETRAGSFLGTPAFMAPEQATGDVAHISPRTDVFGLGAVLCTLLTGQPPYLGTNSETTRLMAASIKQDEAIERLNKCGAEKDIIELCIQCLAPVPGDRPETGVAVAKQIAALRLASDERARKAEIECAKTEVAAEAQRKRRRQQVFAAGAVAAVALIGAATAGLYWRSAVFNEKEAVKQKKDADEQRGIAETRAREAQATLNFFLNDLLAQADADAQADAILSTGGVVKTGEPNPRIKTLLDRAAAELTSEKIELRFPRQPKVQAKILAVVGNTYREIGQYKPAIAFLSRAANAFSTVEGPGNIDTIKTQSDLALTHQKDGNLSEAIQIFQKLYDQSVQRLEPDHGNTLRILNNLANANKELGKAEVAIGQLTQVREALDRKMKAAIAGGDKEAKLYRDGWMEARNNLAEAYLRAQMFNEAIALFLEVYEDRKKHLSPEHPKTLRTLMNLASAYRDSGEFKSSITRFEEARDGYIRSRGPEHPETLATLNNLALARLVAAENKNKDVEINWKEDMRKVIEEFEMVCTTSIRSNGQDHANTLEYQGNLAKAHAALGDRKEAIKRLEDVYAKRKVVLGEDDDDTHATLHYVAEEYLKNSRDRKKVQRASLGIPSAASLILATAFERQRRSISLKKSIDLYAQLVAAVEAKHGPDHPRSIQMHYAMGNAYFNMGIHEKKLIEFETAAQRIEKLNFIHMDSQPIIFNLDDAYTGLQRYGDSEQWLKKWLKYVRDNYPKDSPVLALVQVRLGRSLDNQQKWAEAVESLKECYAIRKQRAPGKHTTYNTQSMLGGVLFKDGKNAEAEPLLTDSFENLFQMKDQIPDAELYFIVYAANRLIKYYEKTKQPEKAKSVKSRLAEFTK